MTSIMVWLKGAAILHVLIYVRILMVNKWRQSVQAFHAAADPGVVVVVAIGSSGTATRGAEPVVVGEAGPCDPNGLGFFEIHGQRLWQYRGAGASERFHQVSRYRIL